jgi:hypothetical protein
MGCVDIFITQRREGAKERERTISFSSSLRLCVIKILPERAFGPALKEFDSLLAGGDPIDNQSVAL